MQTIRLTRFNWWESAENAMPRVYYGGGKSQQSTSQVSIPPQVLAQYQNVNSIANQVAQTPFQQYSTNPNAFVAPLTPTQEAGVVGTNQYASEAQPYFQTASNQTQGVANQAGTAGGLDANIAGYMSPYNQAVVNSTGQLMQQQFNQAQSGQLGNAIQNGAFGGDRAAVTAANLQQQQGLAYGNTMANLENQNYSQALGAAQQQQGVALNAANQEANIGAGAQSAGLAGAQAQLTAGQAQQQTEQAGLTALYNQFLQQQSYPFQTTQFLANIAEGTGALSGSTTSTNQPAPYFSDERLKDDIEPIGETYDGQKIVKFRYKGDKQKHIGLIAQDVERRHPHAVGLAGGYKTVDYDAATRDAANYGRANLRGGHKDSSQGGLVASHPYLRLDGSIVPERRHFDAGGYAGLSPNAAWSGGFYLDPSYLQAMEASYANAPWGNAGPVAGSTPYGGKSHVPPSMGGIHASLSVARPPAQHNSNGLQQLASGVGQLEGLGKAGKSLFNDVKGYVPGLAPSSSASTAPSPAMGAANSNTPPPPASSAPPPPSNASDNGFTANTPAQSSDASGLVPSLTDTASAAPDLSGLDGLGDVFSKRGGRIKRDSGGPANNQPTDSTPDDQSQGGDVPYDSGTGAGGLDIPDDKSNNHLAVAQPPSNSSGSGGGFNPLGIVGPILGLFGLASGGRVGLAGGGLPANDAIVSDQEGNPTGDLGGDYSNWLNKQPGLAGGATNDIDYLNQGRRSLAQAQGMSGYEDTADKSPEKAPVAAFTDNSGGLAPPGRDITVHKAPPKRESLPKSAPTGLNPDVPAQNAQPVQALAPTSGGNRVTEPGEVLNQGNEGGVSDFLNAHQGLIVPLLHGLGTMASSNSRYLGSAILQGLGGAADSYENVQNEMQQRHGLQPVITERQAQSLNQQLVGLAQFNDMNGTHLTLPQYQQYLRTGQMPHQNPQMGAGNASNGAPPQPGSPNWNFSQAEKMNGVTNGIPNYNNPAYNRAYAAHWAGVGETSPYYRGNVDQANHVADQATNMGVTYDANGNQITPPGYGSRIIAQEQPKTQAQQAQDFQNKGIAFAQEAGRNMSLFDELGNIYKDYQAGPSSAWRADVTRWANEYDPEGKYPLLHNLINSNNAADYDIARKDIAQLTIGRLGDLPGGAPRAMTEELNQFAADPHLSPAALRDIIVRGKASVAQGMDYYSGFDPFGNGSRGVAKYTNDFFYKNNPYENYRRQFEKATPAFAGETTFTSPALNGGNPRAQATPPAGAPPDAKRAPDGNWYVPDPNRPGKYLRVD